MQTPEYAAMDGVVLEAGPASGFGLAVYIQHQNGDVTVYGHMDSILVQAGQVVRAGDTIALLGNRGQSTGPHLHFEVHAGGLDGEKIDPSPGCGPTAWRSESDPAQLDALRRTWSRRGASALGHTSRWRSTRGRAVDGTRARAAAGDRVRRSPASPAARPDPDPRRHGCGDRRGSGLGLAGAAGGRGSHGHRCGGG